MREIKGDCCKPEVVRFKGRSWYFGIAHCRSRLYVYSFTQKPVLDHLEGLQYSDYLRSSPPAVIARYREYSTDEESHAVGRGHVYASCFVTHFAFGTPFISVIIAKYKYIPVLTPCCL